MRRNVFSCALAMLSAFVVLPVTATADPVDLNLNSGTLDFDTTGPTPTYTINGGSPVAGSVQNGRAVFHFGNLNLTGSLNVTLDGDLPLSLRSSQRDAVFNIGVPLNLSGGNGGNTNGGVGRLGGGAGGNGTPPSVGGGPGGGPLGPPNGGFGGAGGGFGGVGGYHTHHPGGGAAYDFSVSLAGSGGGGGATCCANAGSGGAGGGGIEFINEFGTITFDAGVNANGGDGTGTRAGGGGSGGGIFVDAGQGITITGGGFLFAEGGDTASTTRSGGAGGGGIIELYAPSLTIDGNAIAEGPLSNDSFVSVLAGMGQTTANLPSIVPPENGLASFFQIEARVPITPEPGSFILLGVALAAFGFHSYRRRQ